MPEPWRHAQEIYDVFKDLQIYIFWKETRHCHETTASTGMKITRCSFMANIFLFLVMGHGFPPIYFLMILVISHGSGAK